MDPGDSKNVTFVKILLHLNFTLYVETYFHREMEEPSRSTSRFFPDNALAGPPISRKNFWRENSNYLKCIVPWAPVPGTPVPPEFEFRRENSNELKCIVPGTPVPAFLTT